MFRCAKCREIAHPASSYLLGFPLCQSHLAEAEARAKLQALCDRVDSKLAKLPRQLPAELAESA